MRLISLIEGDIGWWSALLWQTSGPNDFFDCSAQALGLSLCAATLKLKVPYPVRFCFLDMGGYLIW